MNIFDKSGDARDRFEIARLSHLIEPIRTNECGLAQLLSDITPENLHTEVDFGAPAGKENQWTA